MLCEVCGNREAEEQWTGFYLARDRYLVSSIGRVKSIGMIEQPYRGRILTRSKPQRILKCSDNGNGYLYFRLKLNGKFKNQYVHEAIFFSFSSTKKTDGYDINHKDCNKKNNKMENLEYITRKQNLHHAINNGLLKNRNVGKGERHWSNKYPSTLIIKIFKDRYIKSSRLYSKEIGIPWQTITDIWARRSWKWLTKDINIQDPRKLGKQ